MQIVVDKVLVNYSDTGSGPALVCLHGWMMDKSSYEPLAKELSNTFRIISVDLPNFGQSQNTDTILTIDSYAQFVADFIAKLELDSYYLVGHSMGGQIAVYGTGSGRLSPDKLVLIAASGVRDERKITKAFLRTVAKLLGPAVPLAAKKRLYKLIGSDYEPNLSALHKKIIKQVLSTDVQAMAERMTIPTLLIYGSLDTSTPVRMAKKLAARVKSSRLVVVDGEQHWPHQTSASRVATEIQEFVGEDIA